MRTGLPPPVAYAYGDGGWSMSASLYGMLIDPHGVTWVVDVIAPYTA